MRETTNVETDLTGTVLIVRPEKVPRKKNVPLNNEEFQSIIQGNLQIIRHKKLSIAFIFDKDRDILRLPLNRVVFCGDQKYRFELYGPFIVVGMDEDHNYTGLSEEQVRYFKNRFHVPAKMIAVDGKPTIVFDLLAR